MSAAKFAVLLGGNTEDAIFASCKGVPQIFDNEDDATREAEGYARLLGVQADVIPMNGLRAASNTTSEAPARYFVLCDADSDESFVAHDPETGVPIAFATEAEAISEAETLDATSLILRTTATVIRTVAHRIEKLST